MSDFSISSCLHAAWCYFRRVSRLLLHGLSFLWQSTAAYISLLTFWGVWSVSFNLVNCRRRVCTMVNTLQMSLLPQTLLQSLPRPATSGILGRWFTWVVPLVAVSQVLLLYIWLVQGSHWYSGPCLCVLSLPNKFHKMLRIIIYYKWDCLFGRGCSQGGYVLGKLVSLGFATWDYRLYGDLGLMDLSRLYISGGTLADGFSIIPRTLLCKQA